MYHGSVESHEEQMYQVSQVNQWTLMYQFSTTIKSNDLVSQEYFAVLCYKTVLDYSFLLKEKYKMATSVTTIVIGLMNGSLNFVDTETTASNVGELRAELGLTGSIAVGEVIAVDSTELTAGALVSHVSEGVKGGK